MMGRRVKKKRLFSIISLCDIEQQRGHVAMTDRRINCDYCWPADQPVKCAHGSFVDYVAYASSIDTCMALISSVCCISCCISCTRLDHLTRVWPWCLTLVFIINDLDDKPLGMCTTLELYIHIFI